jgi:hypothetical protein
MARKVGQIVGRGPTLGWCVLYNGRAGQVTNDSDLAAEGQSERIGKAERPVGDHGDVTMQLSVGPFSSPLP